jgi:hypothetical protein
MDAAEDLQGEPSRHRLDIRCRSWYIFVYINIVLPDLIPVP